MPGTLNRTGAGLAVVPAIVMGVGPVTVHVAGTADEKACTAFWQRVRALTLGVMNGRGLTVMTRSLNEPQLRMRMVSMPGVLNSTLSRRSTTRASSVSTPFRRRYQMPTSRLVKLRRSPWQTVWLVAGVKMSGGSITPTTRKVSSQAMLRAMMKLSPSMKVSVSTWVSKPVPICRKPRTSSR